MRFIKQSPLNVYGLTQANENPPTIQAESQAAGHLLAIKRKFYKDYVGNNVNYVVIVR